VALNSLTWPHRQRASLSARYLLLNHHHTMDNQRDNVEGISSSTDLLHKSVCQYRILNLCLLIRLLQQSEVDDEAAVSASYQMAEEDAHVHAHDLKAFCASYVAGRNAAHLDVQDRTMTLPHEGPFGTVDPQELLSTFVPESYDLASSQAIGRTRSNTLRVSSLKKSVKTAAASRRAPFIACFACRRRKTRCTPGSRSACK